MPRLARDSFLVGKFIAHIEAPQFGSMNRWRAAHLNAPSTCRAQPRLRFQDEADMNRQARPFGSVEYDHGRHRAAVGIGQRGRRRLDAQLK
jgi:hypothetical protein